MTEQTSTPETSPSGAYFDAVLHPHRSLGPKGFLIFMALLGAISFTAGMVFLLNGAWPVFGFFGLDVLIVYIAFKLNYRSGRAYEVVRLSEDQLLVERVNPGGDTRAWAFEPYWARVELDRRKRLLLRSRDRTLEFGRFLSEEEKESFSEALRDALRDYRTTPLAARSPNTA
ncbi:MAG: DUF2244 domain-containing protein [Alphaproteobacteria bacterium]|nr:DUF2244 domain-containing protein [Alphaproteobacteria bacterium]